jgi:hypothetical protein
MSILSRKELSPKLTEQEKDFLLKTLSSCKFDGKDVFLLSSIINKLSEQS